MGLSFLTPLFLAGVAALAVPIIIHMVHRQRPEGLPFPSLMFLHQIPHKTQRRQRIRHWFLFVLRCLAVLLVVLAFARPLLERSAQAAAALLGGRDIVVALDGSYSMEYGDQWERAVDAARAAVDAVGPEDRLSLVVFDDQAHAVTQPTGERTVLHAALAALSPGPGATRYGPVLKLAEGILANGTLSRKEVIVISDFQRTGWDRRDDVRLPGGVTITPVDVSTADPGNVGVAAVTLRVQPRSGREQVVVSARLVRTGSVAADSVTVDFELNGKVLQTQQVPLDREGATAVTFAAALLPDGPSRGVVRITGDALARDDAFYFVTAPGQALSILVLESSTARPNQSLYLARALGVGDRPAFRAVVKPLGTFRLSDADGQSVIVLNDAPFPSGAAGERLRRFVEEGGGLLVALGDRASSGWPQNTATLLPGVVGARVERDIARGASLADIDYGHPVFDVFSAPRSGDFSSVKFFRYREVRVSDGDAVLAGFDDRGVALVERRTGRGRVLVWTSTLDTYWNDLALHPVFVPFVHQIAKYLAGYTEARPWYTVGAVADLQQAAASSPTGDAVVAAFQNGVEVLVEPPSGDRRRVTAGESPLLRFAEQGFYDIRDPDATRAPVVLAANVDPAESDITSLDVEEFVSALHGEGVAGGGAGGTEVAAIPMSREAQEQRQGVWRYLLWTALLILGLETLVSNRMSRVVR